MISRLFKLFKRLINKLNQEKKLNSNKIHNSIYINKIITNKTFNNYKIDIVVNLFIHNSSSKGRHK